MFYFHFIPAIERLVCIAYVLNGMPNGRYTLPALVYTGLAGTAYVLLEISE